MARRLLIMKYVVTTDENQNREIFIFPRTVNHSIFAEIYKDWGAMDKFDLVGTYWMVRNLWQKILEVLPNKENLLEAYKNDALPSNVRTFRGAPNYRNLAWRCEDKFSSEDIIKAHCCYMLPN